MKRSSSPLSCGGGDGAAAARKKKHHAVGEAAVSSSMSTGDLTLGDVFGVQDMFLNVASFMHWTDAMTVGSTVCKHFRKVFQYKHNQDKILQPLLRWLEGRLGEFDVSAFRLWDPRRHATAYEALPTDRKCSEMVRFLALLVSNMRHHMKLSNPCFHELVVDERYRNHYPYRDLLPLIPRRVALAFNILFAENAQEAMLNPYFNPTGFRAGFLSTGEVDFPIDYFWNMYMGSFDYGKFGLLSNEKLVEYLRHKIVLPMADDVALLGPTLSSLVILCAPMLDWINRDGELVLPDGNELEPYDEATVRATSWSSRSDDDDDEEGEEEEEEEEEEE